MQNLPFNGTVVTNDLAVTDTYPKIQLSGTESGALYFEFVEIAGTLYQGVQNAAYIKWSNEWILIDPTKPAYALAIINGTMTQLTNPAGNTPFTTWQTVGNVVGKPQVVGIQTGAVCDGSAPTTVSLSPAFLNATSTVLLSIGANYTGTDNAVIMARLSAVPTKSSFTAILSGGQTGTTVDLHYLAFGS